MDENQRARLDAHSVQAHLILAGASADGEVEENDKYVLGYTGVDLPTYNFFIPLTLTGLTDETLAHASAFFRTRDTMYAVSLEEHRVPDGTEYLSKRRYQPLPPQTIMACDSLPTTPMAQNQLSIEPVATVPGMTALYTVLKSVFDYTSHEVITLFPTTQLRGEQIKHFVGFSQGGFPVTVGTAIYAQNIVSIWNLCTLDHYRRQGFATAILNYIMRQAAGQGCDM
ncbi:MAG: GNAT family N-acetyltransferase, partial [Anaerolineae bacterium]